MKFKVDGSKKFLVLVDSTELEYEQLQHSFTKKVVNWAAIRDRSTNRPKVFETKFIDKYNRVPIGLWNELQKLSQKFMFNLEIEGIEYIYDKNFDESDFIEWVNTYFEENEKQPRDYQIEGVARILKYRNCVEEISTSGGKTLMAFLLFRYLFDKHIINKMLYVVPSISLVNQTEEEFYIYEDACNKKPTWKSKTVFGGRKDEDDGANIVFGTFQSLVKKDLTYFSKFDAVFIDETHHAKNSSIRNIIIKCYNSKYNVGMTGTLPEEDSLNSFIIQSYLGPCVYMVKSSDLIASKFATPVKVVGIELDYLDEEIKEKLYNLRSVKTEEKDGVKLLNLEKDIVRENYKRLVYVCNTISKSTKNSLVLFSDIKNDYGRKIFNYLKENTDKTVYYIDGNTKAENRDYYKKQMEEKENVIIVASVGVFSEGISINNLHNIFIVESYRSEYIVRQILGRGMRLMEGKEVITVIDFTDNFVYGSHKYQRYNYLYRHAKSREQIYKDRGFPFKSFYVKL